ncbi:MAG: transglycosylase SLT domain-containing protein, partial [Boseongicola sp.]|nr:transglycosylase SLT domain-containing protein [Boseongicola sp.]
MRRFLVPSTVVIIVAGVTGAASESLTSKSRSSLFSKQVDVLDGRAAQQYANSVRLQPPDIIVPGAPESVEAFDGRFAGKFLATAKNAARKYGIPEDLFLRLVQQESAWNPNAVSRKGAIGLAQLMPATARALRVNPRDPVQNLEGGARYLA